MSLSSGSSRAPRASGSAKPARRRSTPKRGPRSAWVRPLNTSKTVRWSKVMTAQARVATGYYDRRDVKEMVLEAVLKELARH